MLSKVVLMAALSAGMGGEETDGGASGDGDGGDGGKQATRTYERRSLNDPEMSCEPGPYVRVVVRWLSGLYPLSVALATPLVRHQTLVATLQADASVGQVSQMVTWVFAPTTRLEISLSLKWTAPQ